VQEQQNAARIAQAQSALDAEEARKMENLRAENELRAQEQTYARGFQEQYGLPPGATAALGPGEQGPTPAGPADVAAAIRGTPSFQRKKEEERLTTDENIRQAQAAAQAQQAAQNVMTLSDRVRLGADIQRVYGDALATVEKMIEYDQLPVEPGGDRIAATNAAVARLAQPAIDQILALVPPAERAGLIGLETARNPGATTTTEQLVASLRAYLEQETDPARARATIRAQTTAIKNTGGAISAEQQAWIDARLAAIDLGAEKRSPLINRGAVPTVNLGEVLLRAGNPGAGRGGALAGPLSAAAPLAPFLARLAGPARGVPRTPAADEVRLQELKAEEADTLAQAAGEIGAFGAMSGPTIQRLARIQAEIVRLGGLPEQAPQPGMAR
jgi:hypothetical protein